jgi:NAD(P)-dependent dehydrogenase (short-subunit alcohol dehydrogenase family)
VNKVNHSKPERKQLAVVTGASAGLGKIIASFLAAQYEVVPFDLTLGNDVRAPQESFMENRPVDFLINCAGINRISWLEDLTVETWTHVMDVNAFGMMRMTQHLLPNLKEARGTVLNIVSNASHMPMRCSAAYNASKGAAHILTLQLARELFQRHGITVFGISPNRLAGTPMSDDIDAQVVATRGWPIEKVREYQMASLPMGEETDPLALGEFIAFLLSNKDRHRFLHGCVLPYGA